MGSGGGRTHPPRTVKYAVMAEGREPQETEQGGVFGNLPSARPGVRSPRRETGRTAADAARAAADRSAAKRRSPPKPPRRRPSPPPPRAEPQDTERRGAQRGGIEDLAWAGITVAAEAATLGVRLLSRAVEAVRKPSDRH